MLTPREQQLLDYLLTFVTDRRRERFAQVLAQRTRWLTVVLDDFYSPHNVSAVLRSCDAFGIQDVHVIERQHVYQPTADVALGSEQWLTIHRYHQSPAPEQVCLKALRARGYRLLAATPHADALPPEEVDVTRPCALIFGGEKDGLSPEIVDRADEAVRIPMCGFVESLNVSVAVAVCLYATTRRLHRTRANWRISSEEQQNLLLEWVRTSVPHADLLERRWHESQPPDDMRSI